MAAKNDGNTNGCIFRWKIENISHCWMKKGKGIESPSFIALEGTKWSLWLYLMGYRDENSIGFFLTRRKNCNGPNVIEFSYQIGFLDKDGLYLKDKKRSTSGFQKGDSFGSKNFASRENVFVTERELFLPEDTLTVQCVLWKNEKTIVKPKPLFLSARTVFKVNRRSFVWLIDQFSTLKPGKRNRFKDDLIDFDLVVNETRHFVKRLDIDIISLNKSIKYFSFKTIIKVSEGEKENPSDECIIEYFGSDLKPGRLSTLKLLENKSRYLINDDLYLNCEYVSSNGSFSDEVCSFGVIIPTLRNEYCVSKEKSLNTPAMVKDFISMYNDGIFSDTEIRTLTQTFPAHKNILSARSPVFKRIFSNDMKNSGHVDIIDLEDDTVRRMLLYIYTDTLEDHLQFENVCKLYAAANKYEIMSLRSRCSSFLVDNLSPIKACDILILADLYQDNDLKSAVENFMAMHGKEIFRSQRWKNFMANNIQLAADVLYRKVFLD